MVDPQHKPKEQWDKESLQRVGEEEGYPSDDRKGGTNDSLQNPLISCLMMSIKEMGPLISEQLGQ